MPRRKPSILAPEGIDISEQGVKPTPETIRKHRKTSFARMCDKGEVTNDMQRAAQEIEMVYLEITRGLTAKRPVFWRVDGGVKADISDRVASAYHERYKPWADMLSARYKRGGPPALEIVVDLVVDARSLDTLGLRWGCRKSYVKFVCMRALLEYATMARWASLTEVIMLDARNPKFSRRVLEAA